MARLSIANSALSPRGLSTRLIMYLPESLECDNADSNLAISTFSLWVNLIYYFAKIKEIYTYIFEHKSSTPAKSKSLPSHRFGKEYPFCFILSASVILLR